MRRSRQPIVIASRRSLLARAQTEMVGKALMRLHPGVEVQYRWLDSEGDQMPEVSLADRGGKGLFTRRVERALLKGEADLAVHSLKDLPVDPTPGLQLAAIGKRVDVRDVLISAEGYASLADLPEGAMVGTSAPRRAAQLLNVRPDLRITALRGNVDTRLAKTLSGEAGLDATLLAAAGLLRLGKKEHLTHRLDVDTLLPAASQAALAIQCRADDHVTLTRCLPLNHAATATAVHAEREVVFGLEGDCHSPIAAYAVPCDPPGPVTRNADAHWFRLRVRVLSPDGVHRLDVDERVMTKELRRLVKRVIEELRQQGAREMILGRLGADTPKATHSRVKINA